MLLTESEALTKHCPLARVTTTGLSPMPAYNRVGSTAVLCLGRACMGWQWAREDTMVPKTDTAGVPRGWCSALC